MRPTQVVNVRTEGFSVYCGRAVPSLGLPRSKWANPFRIGIDGDRATVLDKYRAHLFTQPELLAQLGELAGHKLGCWCAPDKCHCDLLARLADQVRESNIPATVEALQKIARWQCLQCGHQLQPQTDLQELAVDKNRLVCPDCKNVYRPDLAVLATR